MPKHTDETRRRFNSLLVDVMKAKITLTNLQIEAENAGDSEKAKALYEARRSLDELTIEIVAAQKAFLFSTAAISDLIGSLDSVVSQLKSATKAMVDAKSALDAANRIIGLIGSLAGLLA
jgi:hypothetical protein